MGVGPPPLHVLALTRGQRRMVVRHRHVAAVLPPRPPRLGQNLLHKDREHNLCNRWARPFPAAAVLSTACARSLKALSSESSCDTGGRTHGLGSTCSCPAMVSQAARDRQYTMPHCARPVRRSTNLVAISSAMSATQFLPFFTTSYLHPRRRHTPSGSASAAQCTSRIT